MDAATLYVIVTLMDGRERVLASMPFPDVTACQSEAAAMRSGKRSADEWRWQKPFGSRLTAVCGLPPHMITRDNVSAG